MMVNLFSVFDPVIGGVGLNWVSLLSVYLFVGLVGFKLGGVGETGMSGVMRGIEQGLRSIAMPNYLGLSALGMAVLVYLALNNVLGLFPFVFTSTAHPVVTLGLGVVVWLSCAIMGWSKSFLVSAAHLVPEGAPLVLSPVLVVIETISHLMRPFTLSLRLAANMMAGHLIVGLLSSISVVGVFGFAVSVGFQGVLLVLEWGVAVIQGLVFSILLLLYALEYY